MTTIPAKVEQINIAIKELLKIPEVAAYKALMESIAVETAPQPQKGNGQDIETIVWNKALVAAMENISNNAEFVPYSEAALHLINEIIRK